MSKWATLKTSLSVALMTTTLRPRPLPFSLRPTTLHSPSPALPSKKGRGRVQSAVDAHARLVVLVLPAVGEQGHARRRARVLHVSCLEEGPEAGGAGDLEAAVGELLAELDGLLADGVGAAGRGLADDAAAAAAPDHRRPRQAHALVDRSHWSRPPLHVTQV